MTVISGTFYTPPLDAKDAFYTPAYVAEGLVATLPIRPGDRVMDGQVGGGAWPQAVRAVQPRSVIGGMDWDAGAPALLEVGPGKLLDWSRCGDFTSWKPPSWTSAPHWVVGNPPYGDAAEHVLHALDVVLPGGSVAMLLGVGFPASQDRYERLFQLRAPRRITYLVRRIAFGGRGRDGQVLDGRSTGSRDNVFIWWDLGWTGRTEAVWLDLPPPTQPQPQPQE